MEKDNKNILIADDHILVRSGLELICNNYFPEYKLYFASNLKEIEDNLKNIKNFSLLILDINFEDESSLSFIDDIFELQNNINILVYTGLKEKIISPILQSLGVKGFLNKMADENEIITAIKSVLKGDNYYKNSFKNDNFTQKNNKLKKLTPREIEIMTLYSKGLTNKEISYKLDIKPSTISSYKKRMLEKLGIETLAELLEVHKTYFNSNETII